MATTANSRMERYNWLKRKGRYMDKPDWNDLTGGCERLTRADCFYVLNFLIEAEGDERDALMEWYYALLGSGVLQDWEASDFKTRSELHNLARWGTKEGWKPGGFNYATR